jgi:hypothetical protein
MDCVEKVWFWSQTQELALRFRVAAIGEAASATAAQSLATSGRSSLYGTRLLPMHR